MTARYDMLQLLAPKVTDELIVCGVGAVTREWANLKSHDGNLYMVWMSAATPLALGLALALPHRRVISLDGDGSILMGLSALPAIARQNPSNLVVIVFDNEAYEACKNVPTFTAGTTDLVKVALGAGIRNAKLVREPAEFQEAIDESFHADGTSFIQVKVQLPSPPIPPTALDGLENKYRLVRYIERTENMQIIKPAAMKKEVWGKQGRH